MKTCAYCGRENEEAALACAGCGTDEFKDPSAGALPPADAGRAWVTVRMCANLAEADSFAGQLRAEGLAVFIPDQYLLQNASFGAAYGSVRLQVAAKDLTAARELLATPLPPPPPPHAG